MKLLTLTLSAALISGAAYGQYPDPEIQAYSDRMHGDFRSTAVLEQLGEIQAQQRQIRSEIFSQQLEEQNRCNDLYFRQQHERYLIRMLEDCE